MKSIKALVFQTVIGITAGLLVALIISVVPSIMFGVNVDGILAQIRGYFGQNAIWIAVIVIALLAVTRTPKTFERYSFEAQLFKYKYILFLISLTLLMVVEYENQLLNALEPHRVRYLIVASVAAMLAVLFMFWDRPRKQIPPRRGILQPDITIKDRNDLTPEQEEVFDGIKSLLVNEPQIKAIGVFGLWGSGKSSIVEMVHEEMIGDNSLIWIKFEPWRYTSQESLTLGFYETLGDSIDSAIKGANASKSIMGEIARKLIDKNDKTGVLSAFEPLQYQRDKRDPEKYISELLARENKKIILVLDDIERMYDPENIFRTLQLAHYLKFSDRITYIFIAEKQKLLKSAPRHHGISGEYLEKFIEFEINVPSPQDDRLRDFLNKLLKRAGRYIKGDVTIESSPALIRDSRTHRAILRTFNKFIFDLNDKFYVNNEYVIDLNDKYILDHLSVKYPDLWNGIEQDRLLFVGSLRDEDWSIYRAFADDDKNSASDLEQLTPLLDTVPKEKQEFVKDLLKSVFPKVKAAYESSGWNERHDQWLKEKRVSHPDILDLYFASSETYRDYQGIITDIQSIYAQLQQARYQSEMVNIFKSYLKDTMDLGTTDNLLFFKRDFINSSSLENQKIVKTLLAAFINFTKYMHTSHEEAVLGRILSMADQLGSSVSHDKEKINRIYNYIFRGFLQQKPHPTIVLRILLYLLPTRDNGYYNLRSWDGYSAFRNRCLDYVERFYIREGHDLLKERKDMQWRFVFYQWALGVRTGNGQPDLHRKQKANDYLFSLLKDDKFAYQILKEGYYGTRWNGEGEGWLFDADSLLPFDISQLEALVVRLKDSTSLNRNEQKLIYELYARVFDPPVLK